MSRDHFLKIVNNWQISGGFEKKKSSNNIFLIHLVLTLHVWNDSPLRFNKKTIRQNIILNAQI